MKKDAIKLMSWIYFLHFHKLSFIKAIFLILHLFIYVCISTFLHIQSVYLTFNCACTCAFSDNFI